MRGHRSTPKITAGAAFMAALLALSLLVIGRGVAVAQPTSCTNASPIPQIFASKVVGPQALYLDNSRPPKWNAANGRMTRGDIEYVSSNHVRVELVTDQCAFIKDVRVGARVLSSTPSSYWYGAQPASPQPSDRTQVSHSVSLFFLNERDGSSDWVSITVGRIGGAGVASRGFRLVRVDGVEGLLADGVVGFSRTELFNMFARSLYVYFNGPTNSTVTSDGRRLYDYDPTKLAVDITSSGVSFQFIFKAEVKAFCNPTVRASGKFKLRADASGISIVWRTPAQGSVVHWPTQCRAIQLTPSELGPLLGTVILHLITRVVEGAAASSVKATVTDAIMANLPDTSNVTSFLHGSATRDNELIVNVMLPTPSITVRVPYDAFDMSRDGAFFENGAHIALFASQLGMEEYVAGTTPRLLLKSGPNGVPRLGTAPWPGSLNVSRSGSLIDDGLPVGRLLARLVTSSPVVSLDGEGPATAAPELTKTVHYTPGCLIRVPPALGTSPRGRGGFGAVDPGFQIRFGVNDTVPDAQRLRDLSAPGYLLRLFFLPRRRAAMKRFVLRRHRHSFSERRTARASLPPTGP